MVTVSEPRAATFPARHQGSSRDERARRGTTSIAQLYSSPLSLVLCWIGLFAVSWDRLANVVVGGFNVKLPVLAFFAAFVISLVEKPRQVSPPRVRRVYYLILLIVIVYCGALLFGIDRHAGLGQLFTVLLGAVIPAVAIERVARVHRRRLSMLDAFVAGGVFAAAFGLYQLAASYTGLPQFIEYTGQGGDVGRISSFAYEPAYFGYFLILVLGAMAARDLLEPRPRSLLGLLTIVAALALCNSRAVFFTLPILLLLSLRSGPVGLRRLQGPRVITPLILLALFGAFLQPSVVEFAQTRLGSAFDTREAASNAPRLEVYQGTLDIVRDHPFGIGPGSLRAVAPDYGLRFDPDTPANQVVSNNIWIQSMLDGGIILAIAQVALIIGVALLLWRRSFLPARLVVAGWLTVVIVGGLLTSFFYDLRMWAALGLAMGMAGVTNMPPLEERDGPAAPPAEPDGPEAPSGITGNSSHNPHHGVSLR